MRQVLLLVLLGFFGSSVSAGMPADTEKEIRHLMDYLGTSDCEFNRNGTWYGPHEAQQHLEKKYRYLLTRGLIGTAEQFIERAASQSSMSGRPYLVRCGDAAPVHSRDWFSEELRRFREATR